MEGIPRQLVRDGGHYEVSSAGSPGSDNQGLLRQHDSCRIPQAQGGTRSCHLSYQRNLRVDRSESSGPDTHPSTGGQKCYSRCPQSQGHATTWRMGIESSDLITDIQHLGRTVNRPVCNIQEQEGPDLCVTHAGSSSMEDRCLFIQLEQSRSSLRLSPDAIDSPGPLEDQEQREHQIHPDSPQLIIKDLVPRPLRGVPTGAMGLAPVGSPPVSEGIRSPQPGVPQQTRSPIVACMARVRTVLASRGYSQEFRL